MYTKENDLRYKSGSSWDVSENDLKKTFEFGEGYKSFLNNAKIEREFIDEALKLVTEKGFVNIESLLEQGIELQPGMKVFRIMHNKTMAITVIGKEDLYKGINIVGSHVDSPRLDAKAQPLYQSTNQALFKTQVYGGIKTYQWPVRTLAMHGVITKKDGSVIKLKIGENENDPKFLITDLLPHLPKQQEGEKLLDGIKPENLNVTVGTIPDRESQDDTIKLNILKLLNERYGINEEDLISAEIEFVPAEKACDIGLDRGLVGAYGQDDKACSYANIKAITDVNNPLKTAVCYLADKEEVGSMGNTGAESCFFKDFVADLCALEKIQENKPFSKLFLKDPAAKVRKCLSSSRMLSADVCGAVDPNYPSAYDPLNCVKLGQGVALAKHKGGIGKSGGNDANSEYFAEIKNMFDQKNIIWKHGGIAKQGEGAGNTIAKFFANLGVNVIDCGVPLLNMHAPVELTSKADMYQTYRAYRKFFKIDNYKQIENNSMKDTPEITKNVSHSLRNM